MKTYPRFVSVLFLLGWLSQIFAGAGKIAGRVIDQSTGTPLPGASVIVKDLNIGSSTDQDGIYFILNVPPGTYTVSAMYLGYQTVTKKNIQVRADYTTYLDFSLKPVALEVETVYVTAKKPTIEIGEVSTSQSATNQEIRKLPVLSIKGVLTKQAGIIKDLTFKGLTPTQAQEQFVGNPSDRLHFRGGRANETAYLLDGVYLNDPIWGGFQIDVLPSYALSEITAYTGTFGPTYGEALSAAVNLSVREPTRNSLQITALTDRGLPGSLNSSQTEWAIGGRFLQNHSYFLTGKFLSTDGRFYGYIYPRWRDSEGTDKSGTPIKVPMNYRDILSLLGKVTLRPLSSIRIYMTGLWDTLQTMEYLHFFKYSPYNAPRFWMGELTGIVSLTHLISPSTFYTISGTYSRKFYKGGVYDNLGENTVERHLISPEGFAVSGVAYLWKKSLSKTTSGRFLLVHQSGIHELQLGGELYRFLLHLERRNPTSADPVDSVPPYDFAPWELYTRRPTRISLYTQDKIEFRDIGMVLNFGIRWERVDPKTYWVKDPKHLATSEIYRVSPKKYWSPRIGVSYPVSDNMAFRFSYGVFHQFPAFYLLYQGLNEHADIYPHPSYRDIQTAVGNADMRPERVTSYEAGLQYAPAPGVSLNLAAFYRDLADLVGKRFISGPDVPVEYYMFDNKGYGTVKGIDLTLRKTSPPWTGYLNYTFTQVRISHPDVLFFPQVKFYRPVVADWEVPHKVDFTFSYAPNPGFSLSISGFFSSGLPYTLAIEPNTERGPALKQIDLKVEKGIQLGSVSGSVFLQVFNLFNFTNIYWVYPATGRPGNDGNPSTSPDWDQNPTQYGPKRQIFAGITANL